MVAKRTFGLFLSFEKAIELSRTRVTGQSVSCAGIEVFVLILTRATENGKKHVKWVNFALCIIRSKPNGFGRPFGDSE